jgi:threonine 3-dehydrogenase
MNNSTEPILITGGTGFIGSYLAKSLLEQGKQVVLFDRNPDPLLRRGVSGPRRIAGFYHPEDFQKIKQTGQLVFVQGDLSLLPHVLAVFDEFGPKSVFHLGALLSAGAEANPTQGFQVDLVGTWHVLEAARLYRDKRGTEPVKVIFPSSIASFGDFITAGQQVPNEAVQVPTTIYGAAKVAAERLGEYYSRKPREWVDFRAVRFPSVIGAARGGGGTTAYSTLMIQEPLRKRNYVAYVDKETRLDILYIKDAIKALMLVHDANPASLDATVGGVTVTRRVYNIAGIRNKDG